MELKLPQLGKKALEYSYFPTKHQAFIFRAAEHVSVRRMAQILDTSEENVRECMAQMGLQETKYEDLWMKKGYITVIRKLWHILPYEQLTQLLEISESEFALMLREEDFFDHKLGKKPVCDRVTWRELTSEEVEKTRAIRTIVESIPDGGFVPFDFKYDVDKIEFSGEEKITLRMLYCFSGLYLKAFDVDSREYCPDEMLEAYSKVGINGIWTQAALFQLTEFPFAKGLSEGYEKRLEKLRDFTERCDSYGIKLYLYINEPRCMPESFFKEYPHMRGHEAKPEEDKICLCTSEPSVIGYIRDGIASICRSAPKLGGFFTITRSENPTNCYSHSEKETCTCPRCSKRSPGEVIGEVISAIAEGAHSVDKDIKVLAWSWGWRSYSEDIIDHLPTDVTLLAQSELHMPFNINGVEGQVVDYSMGITGPSEWTKAEWDRAKSRGIACGAKVQINTTWEGSTVPALPVYPLVEDHMRKLREEGVTQMLMSWTLGGFPSRNVMSAAKYFYESASFPESGKLTDGQRRATELFAKAFKEFPFHITVLYRGPQNGGPGNPLYDEPTGYNSTMTCFAYDEISIWRGIYPIEKYEEQLDKLCTIWKQGLEELECSYDSPNASETEIMAYGAYCLYYSSLCQVRFYRAREAGDTDEMVRLARIEEENARLMIALMDKNPAIGFEAANHYYFSRSCLAEKIVNCRYIAEKYGKEIIGG